MRWIGITLLVVAVAAATVAVIGALLPARHVARSTARIDAPVETVWQALTDVAAFPEWREDVDAVEVLDSTGGLTWRERGEHGDITYERVREQPPELLVTRITDESLPFGGSWTFELSPNAGATHVTITEEGIVPNPFFRFMSRFVFGHYAVQESFLRGLGRRFGQEVRVERIALAAASGRAI